MDVELQTLASSSRSLAVHGEDINFYYNSRKKDHILNGLNISVERGIIYGLLGPSGCGKTTLLRSIVGRLKPNSGTIKVFGHFPGEGEFSIPGPGVGYMPQELALYPEITIEETLVYFGRLNQLPLRQIKERIQFLISFLDIPIQTRLVQNLSGGQQRRVSLAAAMIHKPPLLILDEPTVGVDPLLRQSIWAHLQKMAVTDHLTIIITTHYVEEARKAHVVGLMREGRLLAESNPDHLIKRHSVFSLEDVFLKLCNDQPTRCAKDEQQVVKDEGPTEVWVHQKVKETKHSHDVSCGKNNGVLRVCSVDGGKPNSALLDPGHPIKLIKNQPHKKSVINSSIYRLTALTHKNFIRLKRNLVLLGFQLLIPAIQAIMFFICMGREPFDLPIAVVNMERDDPGGMGRHFIQYLDKNIVQQKSWTNLSLAIESVKNGENWAVIHIGPSFSDSIIERFLQGIYVDNSTIENSIIELYMDMSNKLITTSLVASFLQSFHEFAKSMMIEYYDNPMFAKPPIVLKESIYGDRNTSYTEFLAPGMIYGITYFMAFALTGVYLINEKKDGLLDRAQISGVKIWEIITSTIILQMVVMVIQVILTLLFVFICFNLSSQGPIILIICAALLSGLCGMSFGLFLSSVCNSLDLGIIIGMGSFLPTILLSGIVWPLEAMPYLLRYISYCLPFTLLTTYSRYIITRGWTLMDNFIWISYLVPVGWIIMFLLLSCIFFTKFK